MRRLLDDFARWSAQLDTAHHAELAQTMLDESGYTGMWQTDKSAEAPGRLENLKELIAAIEEFEKLTGFLEHVSLVMENAEGDAPGDMVSLMTLHSAKGLEFDTVFLPGWEEGLFPHPRALQEKGDEALEEERRLGHVGLTRARTRSYVSFAANRRIHNLWQSTVPSRFVSELPAEHIEVVSEPGLWGTGGESRSFGGVSAGSVSYGGGALSRGRGMLLEGQGGTGAAAAVARTAVSDRGARLSPEIRLRPRRRRRGRQARHRFRARRPQEGHGLLRRAGVSGTPVTSRSMAHRAGGGWAQSGGLCRRPRRYRRLDLGLRDRSRAARGGSRR